jgi:hypothetical protein
VNIPRLYRAAIALFGFSVTLNALDAILVDGLTLLDGAMALVGAGLVTTVVLARDPERHGHPTEPNLQFYLVFVGSVLMGAGTVVSFLSLF